MVHACCLYTWVTLACSAVISSAWSKFLFTFLGQAPEFGGGGGCGSHTRGGGVALSPVWGSLGQPDRSAIVPLGKALQEPSTLVVDTRPSQPTPRQTWHSWCKPDISAEGHQRWWNCNTRLKLSFQRKDAEHHSIFVASLCGFRYPKLVLRTLYHGGDHVPGKNCCAVHQSILTDSA